MPTLGPVVAPAAFDPKQELLCEGSRLQKVIIANNSAIIELAEAGNRGLSGAAANYNTKMPLPPGVYDMTRRVERIRFKRLTEVEPFPVVTLITTP